MLMHAATFSPKLCIQGQEMAAEGLLEKVQSLTDLELAMLVSLMGKEHCIIESTTEALESLEAELQLIASNTLGLACASVQCSQSMTLEDLSKGILIEGAGNSKAPTAVLNRGPESTQYSRRDRSSSPGKLGKPNRSIASHSLEDEQQLANVMILKDLDHADFQIQLQVLELLKTRRIFSRVAVHAAPKQFLMVVLRSTSGPRLNKYLNDHLFMSHYHDPNDGYPNIERGSEWMEDNRLPSASTVYQTVYQVRPDYGRTVLQHAEYLELFEQRQQVSISAEVEAYLHNIITFLRLHRAIGKGITPRATQAFSLLAKCLAPLHGLDFVTPSVVALAAGKVYNHRLEIIDAENERSIQYGSDVLAVSAYLRDLSPELVVAEVLQLVEPPL